MTQPPQSGATVPSARDKPVRLRVGQARGWRYGELPESIARCLAAWIATGRVEDAEVLKPGRVWRVGDWAVKFSPARLGLLEYLRPSPALRSARLHTTLPVRTPRPLVALDRYRGPGYHGSLLVAEFIEGSFLHDAWRAGPAVREHFPDFMAVMHRKRIFHGDFHCMNLLWDGSELVLLDLEGIRHPLRSIYLRPIIVDQWARIRFGLVQDPSLRTAFDAYLPKSGLGWDAEEAWSWIVKREREVIVERLGEHTDRLPKE